MPIEFATQIGKAIRVEFATQIRQREGPAPRAARDIWNTKMNEIGCAQ